MGPLPVTGRPSRLGTGWRRRGPSPGPDGAGTAEPSAPAPGAPPAGAPPAGAPPAGAPPAGAPPGTHGGTDATPSGRRDRALTVVAVAALVVPFAVAVGHLIATAGSHVYLPDDLALIDLHTREALHWRQELGPFDRYGWHHPGPSYYYLLATVSRVLGPGARAEFVGATLVNGSAAVGVVWTVRRRAGAVASAWAAACVAALGVQLAMTGPADLTYSESRLGALVSPWNPTVVVLPLLLTVVLAAASVRSRLALLGAVLVGSFVVQTDISTLPLVAASLVLGAASVAVASRARRRPARRVGALGEPYDPTEREPVGRVRRPRTRRLPSGPVLAALGVAVLVAMWVPPVVEQLTHRPGNLTLLYRFFTSGRPGQGAAVAAWSTVAAFGVAVLGPAETMSRFLTGQPAHAAAALAVTVVALVVGAAVAWSGLRHRSPFAFALGAQVVLGWFVSGLAVSRITGFVTGYLVLWAVVVPVTAAISLAVLPWGSGQRRFWTTPTSGDPTAPRPPPGHGVARAGGTGAVLAAAAVALVAGTALTVQAIRLPPLSAASSPVVARLVAVVTPELRSGQAVYVGVDWADLVAVEEFIGLVDELDARGYHPRVSPFWTVQFGTAYVGSGTGMTTVSLSQWTPASRHEPGYLGHAGGFAVAVTAPS
jgi:hypothetical protein